MKKLLAFCFMLFAVCSCGFQPVYQQNSAIDIYVAPISGTNGIDLRNALNGKFGIAGNSGARYTLEITLDSPATDYKGLQKTGDATWQEIRLNASYVLKDSGVEIARGIETASESYTFVRFLVAANASQNNAIKNSVKTLSEKISARVLAKTNE